MTRGPVKSLKEKSFVKILVQSNNYTYQKIQDSIARKLLNKSVQHSAYSIVLFCDSNESNELEKFREHFPRQYYHP